MVTPLPGVTDALCVDVGCDRLAQTRGMCRMHYQRWLKNAKADAPEKVAYRKPPNVCAVAGCEKPALSRGWCNSHYQRWHTHGDPLAGRAQRRTTTRAKRPTMILWMIADPARESVAAAFLRAEAQLDLRLSRMKRQRIDGVPVRWSIRTGAGTDMSRWVVVAEAHTVPIPKRAYHRTFGL